MCGRDKRQAGAQVFAGCFPVTLTRACAFTCVTIVMKDVTGLGPRVGATAYAVSAFPVETRNAMDHHRGLRRSEMSMNVFCF